MRLASVGAGRTLPTREMERLLHRQGYRLVAGVDEVGRGPLAGPVMAAAVVLSPELDAPWLGHVRDSKALSPAARERLAPLIRGSALGVGVGSAAVEEIDSVGIAEATRRAMLRALASLPLTPHCLLVDAVSLEWQGLPCHSLIKGDTRCLSIATASIVAKVQRDRLMVAEDAAFPGYGFTRHKGYGTAEHLAALERLGPCPIHRRSFAPVRQWAEGGEPASHA
ncbi:MAG: ribonuclease HII [Chloroflexi bacterium]|nr:ribonuclease HII [Chloroflexota bacterium]